MPRIFEFDKRPPFSASRLKVERANKHIANIDAIIKGISNSYTYSLRIETDPDGSNYLVLDFDLSALPTDQTALMIGDALHNLRSSLDILWHEVIALCDGTPNKYTRFLIRDTRKELISRLEEVLEKKRITETVSNFVLDTIKPYETGNYPLWALDELNVLDKHQLIIPVLKFMWVLGACLEDEKGELLEMPPLISEVCWRTNLPQFHGRKLTIKHKGHATPNIFFYRDPFSGHAIIPTLSRIAEEVTRTIDAFEVLLG